MKKASILITTLFLLSVAPIAVQPAEAQSRTHAKGSKSKRTTTTRTTRTRSHHSRRNHGHSHSHRRHSTHRHRSYHNHNGVRVWVGWPYYDRHYYHGHHTHRHTVVYDNRPDVVVVEPEPGFVMPSMECPIRTEEVRSGMSQWCATGRGTKHGLYRRWYADGVLASEGEYDYDTKHGVWVEFHPNGALREEGEYKNGKRIGTWVTWGSDGQELVAVDY